jgi:hypothetical protein
MKLYSFKKTTLLVNGVPGFGFDEGDDAIKTTRRQDSMTDKVGADGSMAVADNADRSGEIIFRLLQTSEYNTYMGGLLAAQENGLFVPTIVMFKDLLGQEIVSGTQGYIKRPADFSRGKGITGQEWTIVVERLDVIYTQI